MRDTEHDTGLSKYGAGDFVLVARPRKPAKLVGVWRGPWKVVLEGRHICTVETQASLEPVKTCVADAAVLGYAIR